MAGWSNAQTNTKDAGSITGSTGTSLAFSSSVTSGQLIVATSEYYEPASSGPPTFSDTSSNVTSWTTVWVYQATNNQVNQAVAWGIATASAACTPKVTWPNSGVNDVNICIGAFATPGGTISQDGTTASITGSGATVTTPVGTGTGANDLLVSVVGFTGGESAIGGSWALFAPGFGEGIAYLLNAAGNSAPNVSQSPSGGWASMTVALQASGGGAPPSSTFSVSDPYDTRIPGIH